MYKKAVLIVILAIIIIAIPVTVYLTKQRQEIRKEAAGENQLVCDSGANRNDSNTIVVTNNTTITVPLRIQENLCPYAGQGVPVPDSYTCNNFSRAYFNSLQPGQTITFNMVVPDCNIGQLDVQNSDEHQNDDPTECFNVRDNQRWHGGIAFAKKANPNGYNQATQSCVTATNTPAPTNTSTPTSPPGATNTPAPTNTPRPTSTPTVPIGAPTYTPAPTSTPRLTSTPAPTSVPAATPTPTTPPPVSGNFSSTLFTILAGGVLVILGLLL